MEKEHQYDVHEDVVSQEDSQPTEHIINQHKLTATCPLPPDIPTYCSYDYYFLPNVKCEQILPESMPEDNAGSQRGPGVDGRVITGLQSAVKSEGQRPELNEQHIILPIMDTDRVSMKSCVVNELTEMKPEKNADPDEYNSTSSETRHWVVCPGGVLKEVKPEHTHGVSEILPVEDFGENVDNIQYRSGTNDAKLECESPVIVRERIYTGVKHLIGDICGKSFIHPDDLENHERPQTIAKPFTCDACGKSFQQRKSLIRHERIHSGVKPFTCDKCGKSFGRSSILKEHERIHSDVKPFTCDTCGKSFRHAGTLRLHERIHTGIKPFTCDACGKSFIRISALRVHERKHSVVKPFTCETCGKSFTHAAALRYHERIHTRVKSFTCDVCGKSYTRPGALREHERMHTGAFTCDICGKQFSRSGGLKARWQNTHRCENIHL